MHVAVKMREKEKLLFDLEFGVKKRNTLCKLIKTLVKLANRSLVVKRKGPSPNKFKYAHNV